ATPDRPPSPAATLHPTLGYLEAEEFAQSFSLGPAHRNFCLLLVVHSQLIGTLEPGDDFLDAVDVHQVGAVGAPEKIGIEAVQQLFESSAIGLTLNAVNSAGHDRDHAFLDGGEADVFLIDQEQTAGGLDQDLGRLRLLRLQHADQRLELVRRSVARLHFGAYLLDRLRHAFLVEGLEQIVHGVYFERLHRVLIEGGGENNLGQDYFLVKQFLDDAEAIEAGHLHVEKDQVGIMFADETDAF